MLRGVAQPGSAPGLGPGGRRFESCRPDNSSTLSIPTLDKDFRRLLIMNVAIYVVYVLIVILNWILTNLGINMENEVIIGIIKMILKIK